MTKHPLPVAATIVLSWLCCLPAEAAAAEIDFRGEVLPLLQSHCGECHGVDTQEARLRLDALSTDLVAGRAAAERWHDVRNALNAGEMPPEDAPQLSAGDHKLIVDWISSAIDEALEQARDTSGRVVLRRLNRVEYQNTMRDLLGLDMDYARDLPPDPASAEGFRNDGRALGISALRLEYYLETARRALDRVIVSEPPPEVFRHTFDESNVKCWLRGVVRSNRLGRQQSFLAAMIEDYPERGEFRIRVTLTAALRPDQGFPLLELSVGYRPDTKILFREAGVVEVTSPQEQTLEFRGRLENFPLPVRGQGKFPGLVVRARNAYDDVPLSNLYLTMLRCLGVERPSFADSTGEISELRA